MGGNTYFETMKTPNKNVIMKIKQFLKNDLCHFLRNYK